MKEIARIHLDLAKELLAQASRQPTRKDAAKSAGYAWGHAHLAGDGSLVGLIVSEYPGELQIKEKGDHLVGVAHAYAKHVQTYECVPHEATPTAWDGFSQTHYQ